MITLEVGPQDLSEKTRAEIEAKIKGVKVMNDDAQRDAQRAIIDALPKAIARRVREITPPEFEVGEVTISFSVKGSLWFVEAEGDVAVKLVPKAD